MNSSADVQMVRAVDAEVPVEVVDDDGTASDGGDDRHPAECKFFVGGFDAAMHGPADVERDDIGGHHRTEGDPINQSASLGIIRPHRSLYIL